MNQKLSKYSTIIWDWRSTLYNPNLNDLYDWVRPFLKESKLENILISWAANPSGRSDLIKSFRINKYFSKIIITSTSKLEEFEKLFDLGECDPEKTLVIGDNVNDEIKIAKELGIDSMEVDTFVKYMGLAKVS